LFLCVFSVSGISLFCRSHFLWRCVADLLLSQDPGVFHLVVVGHIRGRHDDSRQRQGGDLADGRCAGRKPETNRLRFIFVYPVILALGVMVELTLVPKLAAFALLHIS